VSGAPLGRLLTLPTRIIPGRKALSGHLIWPLSQGQRKKSFIELTAGANHIELLLSAGQNKLGCLSVTKKKKTSFIRLTPEVQFG